jgi:hypothetical protein
MVSMRFRGLLDGKNITEVGVDAELPNLVDGRFRSRSNLRGVARVASHRKKVAYLIQKK